MLQNKVTILCTALIDEASIKEVLVKNLHVEVLPFVRSELILSKEVQQEIEQALMLSATVVFTSVNAVEAVATELEGQEPDWQIFCIGHATLRCVEKYFEKNLVCATALNAKDLAALITNANINEVIFFCGDQRRNELPAMLKENGIDVNEIIVYQTELLPRKIEKKYDGILFFSPSAVKSFFQINELEDTTILFAIGATTATEIRKHSQNKVIVSDQPDKKVLLDTTINYFQANSIRN